MGQGPKLLDGVLSHVFIASRELPERFEDFTKAPVRVHSSFLSLRALGAKLTTAMFVRGVEPTRERKLLAELAVVVLSVNCVFDNGDGSLGRAPVEGDRFDLKVAVAILLHDSVLLSTVLRERIVEEEVPEELKALTEAPSVLRELFSKLINCAYRVEAKAPFRVEHRLITPFFVGGEVALVFNDLAVFDADIEVLGCTFDICVVTAPAESPRKTGTVPVRLHKHRVFLIAGVPVVMTGASFRVLDPADEKRTGRKLLVAVNSNQDPEWVWNVVPSAKVAKDPSRFFKLAFFGVKESSL